MAQRPVHFWYEMAPPLRYGIRRASAMCSGNLFPVRMLLRYGSWMSSAAGSVSWRWRRGCGALVRDWKWTDFCSRPAMRSISSWIAPVVMRHSSLLLMVLFDHAGAWKAMPLGTHY
jgi:hypothetical protein